jgi:Mg2+ and Co2+ transporter CorA
MKNLEETMLEQKVNEFIEEAYKKNEERFTHSPLGNKELQNQNNTPKLPNVAMTMILQSHIANTLSEQSEQIATEVCNQLEEMIETIESKMLEMDDRDNLDAFREILENEKGTELMNLAADIKEGRKPVTEANLVKIVELQKDILMETANLPDKANADKAFQQLEIEGKISGDFLKKIGIEPASSNEGSSPKQHKL